MSANSSPTTPKAKPADIAAPSSLSSIHAGAPGGMAPSEHDSDQGLGHRSADPRSLEYTQAPNPQPPRSSFEGTARDPNAPVRHWPTFGSFVMTGHAAGPSRVALSGSNVRSSAGFKIGAVPGNYRSPFDHNMVHRSPKGGLRPFPQHHHASAMSPSQVLSAATPLVQAPRASVPVSAPQVRAVIPPPGTPNRVVLLGPLRMIRGQCAKKNTLHPILVWIDQYMGEELRTPFQTDPLVANIVYAVNIPMDEEHWRDWNKVLAVFPRATAWQEALTLGEMPFDQVTGEHPTKVLFREGEELESLLADLIQTYNLGVQHDVNRPWDLLGQRDWKAPEAREAHSREGKIYGDNSS
ncbi:hypothetical protein EKO04_009751 [Ascochyta lentis]|uniref:Uncharacterized protein n=1 Tax=Ascochyta lentis TaxID=205686 RepID=A0A8H7MES8_9PLEO|nr:hypothetical protein EKO04_009751 [Ascochyta lentis]